MAETSPLLRPGAAAPLRQEDRDDVDVSELLRIGTRGPWLVYAIVALSNVAFALATLDRVHHWWPSVAALVAVNGTGLLLMRRHPDPMPRRWAFALWAAVVASTVLVAWNMDAEQVGRESWFMLGNTWLLFFVILRGRTGWAWASFFSMIAVHAYWAIDTDRDPVGIAMGYQTHAAVLFVASLLRLGLRRASRRINALRQRSLELASSTATSQTEREMREAKMGELSRVAAPLLARVASGPALTREDRLECLLAEAALRDAVRAGVLYTPAVAAATQRARRRGVEVTLLDDRGELLPTEAAMKVLLARVTECLDTIEHGRVSVRLAPKGRPVAASIVVEQQGRTRSTDLDEDGEPVEIGGPMDGGGAVEAQPLQD